MGTRVRHGFGVSGNHHTYTRSRMSQRSHTYLDGIFLIPCENILTFTGYNSCPSTILYNTILYYTILFFLYYTKGPASRSGNCRAEPRLRLQALRGILKISRPNLLTDIMLR